MFPTWCLILISVSILNVCANVLRDGDLYRLDIIHYNDFHDRFEETSVSYPVCKYNDTNCIGGFARLYYEIQELLQEKPGALLLNAGDVYQGTYWYTLLKWELTQKFINMLPNDAHALGNHEFDDRVAGLVPYIKSLNAPVVAANIVASEDSPLHGLYQPYVIAEKNGRKIGIIGLTTKRTELLANPDGVTLLDPIPVAKEQALILTDKGVDIIVLLSHCGLDVDKKIAKEVGENIDVIVGGHTHSLLWNGDAPSRETISGPYPVMIESEAKPEHKVVIVTASAFTKYLGNLTVFFDKNGEVQSYEGTPVFLNRSIPEDPKIKELLEPYKQKLHKIVGEMIGYTNGALDTKICSSGECPLGNLVADAFLNISNELHPTTLPSVAFLLGNMLRSAIPKGEITRGDIINMLPFTNKVGTIVLPGRYLLEAFEKCIANPWTRSPYSGPWTPQVAGIRLTFNTTSGNALSVLVKEGDVYKPLDLEKDYQVTTVDFLMQGRNGFTMLPEHGRNYTIIGNNTVVLEDYIKKVTPIIPAVTKRLTLLA